MVGSIATECVKVSGHQGREAHARVAGTGLARESFAYGRGAQHKFFSDIDEDISPDGPFVRDVHETADVFWRALIDKDGHQHCHDSGVAVPSQLGLILSARPG